MELLLIICRRTMNGRHALHVTWCFVFHATRSAWMEVDMGLVETNKEAAAAGNEAATARNTKSGINAYLE
jgi:hypothetical protein